MKLEAESVTRPERLDREVASLGQQFGAIEEAQTPRGASGRRDPASSGRARAPPPWGGSDNIRPPRGLPDAARPARRAAWPASARPGKSPETAAAPAAARRSSRSPGERNSSGSLALIGPPKMTAPAWPSSVSGSGSPKRGRRISSGCPSARSALPTRPGVEVSWCRTISTGSSERRPRARPGLRCPREVQHVFGIDFARLERHRLFLYAATQAETIPKQLLISCEFMPVGKQIAGQRQARRRLVSASAAEDGRPPPGQTRAETAEAGTAQS